MIDPVALSVFVGLFLLVTGVGFAAVRWKRADLRGLDEWALGGRRFGTFVVWFLLGGDLYTAYTFIAVPALMYGAGAVAFFAVPYTVLAYPIAFMLLPRLWASARRNGYVTAADFVYGEYGSRALELAIALTGLLATLPYIALQLVGIEVIISALGITGTGVARDLPLIAAFTILAVYTYTGGLRAPALIAFVKDAMIYVTIAVAVVVIPLKLGGFGHIFATAQMVLGARAKPASIIVSSSGFSAYATLALGSAMALFLYPHSITAVLSSRSADVIRRNAALLPAYSLLLALIALLGFMALAAGITPSSPNFAVPDLFRAMFPSWFVGFAFAAIAIGALVPAAIMSIAAGNLVARNLYGRYLRPHADSTEEARVAKLISLAVKFGAVVCIIIVPQQYAINLQLVGGVCILQTFPSIAFGLFSRWFHHRALFAGWLTGMALGAGLIAAQGFTAISPVALGTHTFPMYTALVALTGNIVIATLLTPVLDRLRIARNPPRVTRSIDADRKLAGGGAAGFDV
jgi:SSS family solute:Na+ symporter